MGGEENEQDGTNQGSDDTGELLRATFVAKRRGLLRGVVLLLIGFGCGLILLRYQAPIQEWGRGEIDLAGDPIYRAAHPAGPVDWPEVHAELLPAWVIAQGTRQGTEASRARNANRAHAELRYALAGDPNLVEIVDELDQLLQGDPLRDARRIDYLMWAYNHHLDTRDAPWRLEATMHLRRDGSPAFLTRSYQIMSDLRNERSQRLRLLRRVDLTNVEEGFLGHTTGRDEGAMVMLDETLHFAVTDVWPLLQPGLDEYLPARVRGIAPYVRQEASRGLPVSALAVLAETAVDELALIEVADAIHARAECGNSFRIYGLPWNGLAPPDQRALVEALGRSKGRECPEVTLGEAARMIGASERLESTEDLASAVEALTLWSAQAVSIHELRHDADGPALQCIGCPEGMNRASRNEVSAYVASFTVEGSAYLALAQACGMQRSGFDHLTPHGQALGLVLSELLPGGCEGEIPEDLVAKARLLEERLFGARSEILLPEHFPQSLAILDR